MLHFVNKLKGGVIPAEFLPSIEMGLREEAKSGGRTGYPLVDLKVTLVDGATHDVDSNDLAFRFAASRRAAARPCRRPARCCSSRSCGWRSSLPKTIWAESPPTCRAAGP